MYIFVLKYFFYYDYVKVSMYTLLIQRLIHEHRDSQKGSWPTYIFHKNLDVALMKTVELLLLRITGWASYIGIFTWRMPYGIIRYWSTVA